MRIEEVVKAPHTAPMDEQVADALLERATDLAYQRFGEETTDDHIEWAFQRLVMQWRWGAGAQGVVTVH